MLAYNKNVATTIPYLDNTNTPLKLVYSHSEWMHFWEYYLVVTIPGYLSCTPVEAGLQWQPQYMPITQVV